MDAETIKQSALSLPAQARAELAEQLLSSLDSLSESEIAQLWLVKAARRAQEIDSGSAPRFSAEAVQLEAQTVLK